MGCGEGIRPDERGAATGLLAGLGLLFAMSLWCAVCLAGWWGCARTADDTADTAALAGAAAEVVGRDGCTVAEATARANGARLAGCTVDGAVVTVEVSVALRPTWDLAGLPREVTRRAVAGPWWPEATDP